MTMLQNRNDKHMACMKLWGADWSARLNEHGSLLTDADRDG